MIFFVILTLLPKHLEHTGNTLKRHNDTMSCLPHTQKRSSRRYKYSARAVEVVVLVLPVCHEHPWERDGFNRDKIGDKRCSLGEKEEEEKY